MKKAFVVLAVVFLNTFAAKAQTLPAKVENYLSRNYPNWEITESFVVDAPRRKAIAGGDFNGDGKTDYAVVITKDDRIYALALLAAKNSYRTFNLLAQKDEDRWIASIGVVQKGNEVFSLNNQDGSSKSFRLKTDGIAIADGEGMARIYYWQSGKFLWADSF